MIPHARSVRLCSALTAVALLGACATTSVPSRESQADSAMFAAARSAGTLSTATRSVGSPRPKDDEIDLIHPRTMLTLGLGFGNESFDINSGDPSRTKPVTKGDASALLLRLHAEYFFRNQFGLYGSADLGTADDIYKDTEDETVPAGFPDSELKSTDFDFGFAFRATVDDDFRMPVRLGVFHQKSDMDLGTFTEVSQSGSSDVTAQIEYSSLGIRLSAEPEFILMQNITEGGDRTELTAFVEVFTGCGQSKVDSSTDDPAGVNLSEEGFAWNFGWEVGMRYNWNTMLLAASVLGRKVHYDATDSYDQGVLFGVDDDLIAFSLAFGLRF